MRFVARKRIGLRTRVRNDPGPSLSLCACARDFMVFIERCFRTLNPGMSFQDSWYLHAIAEQLRLIDAGELKRLIINVPPRSGKSIMTTIGYSAWRHGHDPRTRIICVSSDDSLVRSLSASYQAIVKSEWFAQAFPQFRIRPGGDRATETITTMRGYRYGVSIGGSVLGRGADLIIADDAMSPMAALSEPVQDPAEQPVGRRLSEPPRQQGGGRDHHRQPAPAPRRSRRPCDRRGDPMINRNGWGMLVIPAIAPEDEKYRIGPGEHDVYHRRAGEVLLPEREPQPVLDEIRIAMGSINFAAQYQQTPVPSEGNIIRRDWIRYFDEEPEEFNTVVSSWDLASTIEERSSFSVGLLVGKLGANFFVLELVRGKFQAPELRRLMMRKIEEWQPDATIVEATELGRSMVQDIRRTTELPLLLDAPRFDKRARLEAQAARFEAGQVHLPRNAPWLGSYLSELLGFPFEPHDDQVDATSLALNYMVGRAARTRPLVRRNPVRRKVVRR